MSETRNFGRGKRLGIWGVGGAAAFATCLLMVLPTAAAGPAPALVTYKAPFHHALITPQNDIVELSGCGKEVGKAATLSAATGLGAWAGSARAATCKGPAGKAVSSSIALVQDAVQLSLPVRVPLGYHNTTFNVTWKITSNGSYTLNYAGLCPNAVYNNTTKYGYSDCIAEAITQIIGYASLVDLTTGTVTYPSTFSGNAPYAYKFVENFSSCFSASSCTYYNYSAMTPTSTWAGTTTVSFAITVPTVGTDRYAVNTYIGGDIVEEMMGYTGTATGFINMATLGNGYQLVSIVES